MAVKPKASSEQVSRNMKNVRVRDTGPEILVRRRLFALGFRYRVNYRPKVAGIGRSSIDIAFPGKRVAVFIDGCFWHCCPEHGELPKANRKWWESKFAENKERDARVTNILKMAGWIVLRFWAHESPENVCAQIADTLSER